MSKSQSVKGNQDRQLTAAERQKAAMELRLAGKTYQAIADELGYAGEGSAFNSVKAALRKTLQEPADELRKAEVARLDRMLEKLWQVVETFPADEVPSTNQLRTIDRILRIMERRAQYLGLDQQVDQDSQIEVTVRFSDEVRA